MDLETLTTNIIKLYPKFGHKWNKPNIKIKYQKGVLFWFRKSSKHLLCIVCSSQNRAKPWINPSNVLCIRRIEASTAFPSSPRSRRAQE